MDTLLSLAGIWGERLKAERQAQDLTQVELAERCGCTQYTISRIERGEHRPLDALKIRLAQGLGVRVEDLFPFDPFVAAS